MPELTLWLVEFSPPANCVLILADLLGLKLNVIDIGLAGLRHKTPEILAMNPLGAVPILKDGDFVLNDSHAQMKYLLAKYGKPEHSSLYPKDIEQQALVDQSLFLDTGVIFIRFKAVGKPTYLEGMKAPTDRHLQDIEAGYQIVEFYLGNKDFVAIDQFTIADISLGLSVANCEVILKVDKKKFPRTTAWLERLRAIPEFHKHINETVKIFYEDIRARWAENSQ